MRLWRGSAAGIAVVLAASACAVGGTIVVDIGGGWEASWDDEMDTYVDITSHTYYEPNDVVIIEKSAEFIQGPVHGVFPSILVTFTQNQADAAEYIAIDDEAIKNSTGVTWIDFHFELLNGPDAVFDPNATAQSGGDAPIGWTIDPFQQAAFSNADTKLTVWDGLVYHGESWYPGDLATDGQLWIDVTPKATTPYTTFVLKQTPTPEPATMSLLALGAMALLRRRQR